ncbi:GNAT family N-acetyltransferase [Corynebacterium mastitidis]|uniref:GNAT family N-acetyltransferase n=1 Tax=Corynebacterium mastitidis TaxID=161890 RepID=UPI00036AB4C6|nr:GNAT family N-acetyltransferase [Corynebacterium mastitidis]
MMTTITHDEQKHRYVLSVEGEEAGFADYLPREDGVLDFNHTVIHESFQGRGLSKVLVRGALDGVREDGLKIAASCSAVRHFLDRNPEYAELEA